MTHQQTLLDLLSLHGGPGFEHEVSSRIRAAFATYTEHISTDTLGNLIARIPGHGAGPHPRVLLSAHMDEIALIVTAIEKGGFLRVWQTGGFDPRTLVGQEVLVHGRERMLGIVGSKPPHLTTPAERNVAAPLTDLYLDLGMSEAMVREKVSIGDRVTLKRDAMQLLNTRISGKALDNRASVAILLEMMHVLQRFKHCAEIYAVATVQEELGVFGAVTAAYGIHPDIAIAVDVTFGDMPGQAPDESFRLGEGPAITFGPNIHPHVFRGLRDTAERQHIPYQIELSQSPTGTDARGFQIARDGIACGVVGIPIRYMHASVETGAYRDIVDCGQLLANYTASLSPEDVEALTCY